MAVIPSDRFIIVADYFIGVMAIANVQEDTTLTTETRAPRSLYRRIDGHPETTTTVFCAEGGDGGCAGRDCAIVIRFATRDDATYVTDLPDDLLNVIVGAGWSIVPEYGSFRVQPANTR